MRWILALNRGNVATLRLNVATFQRVVKTNVTTFQRRAKMTSRRWDPMSQRSREGLIQRRDVEIPRRDVPEEGLIQRRNVEIPRRDSP